MKPEKKTETEVTMEEEAQEQETTPKEPTLSEPLEAPDTGGASAKTKPAQPRLRTDEPTLQEMTNAPSRPLDKALVQDLVDWCGDIPFGHTKFLNMHRDCGEDAVMGPPELLKRIGTLRIVFSSFLHRLFELRLLGESPDRMLSQRLVPGERRS